MGLIMLPLVLPEIIVAMALLVVLLALGVPLSLFTVILGHVLICTPFAIAILSSAFQSLDRSLEEAAYDLGETPLSTFRLIILPLVMPGIISSLADLLHHLAGRIHHRVLPWLGTQPIAVGLHLRPVPLSAEGARHPGAGHASLSVCRSSCLPSLNISAAVASPRPVARIPEASCDVLPTNPR